MFSHAPPSGGILAQYPPLGGYPQTTRSAVYSLFFTINRKQKLRLLFDFMVGKHGTFQMPVDSLLTHTQRYTRFRQTNCSLLLPSREKCRKLFQKAIKSLDRIARQTHDLSIFTDGERRYGN